MRNKFLSIWLILAMTISFLCGNAKSNLDFKSIPTIFNTDSLEKMIPSIQKLSTNYVDHLIILEQSRYNVSSTKFGKYANEIDSISKRIQYQFGIACGSYFKSARNISVSPNYVRSTIEFAENALQLFDELHDEAGIFYSKIVLITSYIYNLRSIASIENSVNNIQSYKSIRQKYTANKYRYLYDNFQYAQKQLSSIYYIRCVKCLIVANYFSTDDFLKKNLDIEKLKKLAFSMLDLIRKEEELKFLLAYQYNILGYVLNDREAINVLKIGLAQAFHPESIQKAVISKQIAHRYYTLDRKLYSDSIIHYLKSELEIAAQHDTVPHKYYHDSYAMLSDLNAEKLNIHEAHYFKMIAYDLLLKHNEHFENILANSYLEFESYKFQKQENEKITAHKSKTDQNLKLSALFIFFLLLLIIILIRNYQSIKSAKNEIERLQHSQEKFYSILTHDIQSPIKSYQGLASKISFLIRKKDFNEIDAIALKIDETGIRLNTIFQNLLEWKTNQENNEDQPLQPLFIKDCILNELSVYSLLIEELHISIDQDIRFHDSLKINQYYFQTVIRNLIDNAIKNAPQYSTIEIQLFTQDNSILFSIKNRAEPSTQKLETIQTLFSSERSWRPGEQGLGLGLILIRDYTIKMNGHIEVKTEDGKINFELQLPKS